MCRCRYVHVKHSQKSINSRVLRGAKAVQDLDLKSIKRDFRCFFISNLISTFFLLTFGSKKALVAHSHTKQATEEETKVQSGSNLSPLLPFWALFSFYCCWCLVCFYLHMFISFYCWVKNIISHSKKGKKKGGEGKSKLVIL